VSYIRVVVVEGEEVVLQPMGHSYVVCESDSLFPNYFEEDLYVTIAVDCRMQQIEAKRLFFAFDL